MDAADALQMKIGTGPVRDVANVPSLALGTGLITPLELTAAFPIFSNGGFAVTPRALIRAEDASGRWTAPWYFQDRGDDMLVEREGAGSVSSVEVGEVRLVRRALKRASLPARP